jgi:hypothetical protein
MVRYISVSPITRTCILSLILIFVAGCFAKVNSTHVSGISFDDTWTIDIDAGEPTDDGLVVLRIL